MRHDDEDDDYDRPLRKKRRKEEAGPPVALIVGILAGVFILVGGALGAYFALRSKAKPEPPHTVQKSDPGLSTKDGPAVRDLTVQWIEFEHPEGVYSVKVPATPVHFSPPKGGSLFAGKEEFFTSSVYVSAKKELLANMEVRVFTPFGLETDKSTDAKLGPQWFGKKATRTTVTWGGREAVEDRDESSQLSVRRRLYVGNRLYQFTITGSPGHPTPEELSTFFDSFKPLKTE